VAEPCRRRSRRCAAPLALAAGLLLVTACAAPGYAPYPLELEAELPPDAFARCRLVLLREYGAIAVDDAAAFRLQTPWVPVDDPPGERRATVYRERAGDADELAIVVELRRVTVPVLGVPGWTEPRGDEHAERALARLLEDALASRTD
jgi:hypothetical protein